MLNRFLSLSRYLVVIGVVAGVIGALALIVYQAVVVVVAIVDIVRAGVIDVNVAKKLAVGLIQAVDVFMIAVAMLIISLGLHALFVDDTFSASLPRWLQVQTFEDMKSNLVSVVIAVLAVLFLREAVDWDGDRDLLTLGAAIALMIAALTWFLAKKSPPKP
jgi:uncharacterized membrane protein YqhA